MKSSDIIPIILIILFMVFIVGVAIIIGLIQNRNTIKYSYLKKFKPDEFMGYVKNEYINKLIDNIMERNITLNNEIQDKQGKEDAKIKSTLNTVRAVFTNNSNRFSVFTTIIDCVMFNLRDVKKIKQCLRDLHFIKRLDDEKFNFYNDSCDNLIKCYMNIKKIYSSNFRAVQLAKDLQNSFSPNSVTDEDLNCINSNTDKIKTIIKNIK